MRRCTAAGPGDAPRQCGEVQPPHGRAHHDFAIQGDVDEVLAEREDIAVVSRLVVMSTRWAGSGEGARSVAPRRKRARSLARRQARATGRTGHDT
jgi:hypothetical protein